MHEVRCDDSGTSACVNGVIKGYGGASSVERTDSSLTVHEYTATLVELMLDK